RLWGLRYTLRRDSGRNLCGKPDDHAMTAQGPAAEVRTALLDCRLVPGGDITSRGLKPTIWRPWTPEPKSVPDPVRSRRVAWHDNNRWKEKGEQVRAISPLGMRGRTFSGLLRLPAASEGAIIRTFAIFYPSACGCCRFPRPNPPRPAATGQC